jgi:protein-disulfide isomerase
MPQLEQEYVKTGKVKYVFRDLPLESIHPYAFKAAEAAHCALEQGRFWEMHNRLFQNQRELEPTRFSFYAQNIELDVPKFTQCLASEKYAAEIRQDMADAANANIQATPSFVIGLANPRNPQDPNIKVLKIISGAQPYVVFKAALDSALAAQNR